MIPNAICTIKTVRLAWRILLTLHFKLGNHISELINFFVFFQGKSQKNFATKTKKKEFDGLRYIVCAKHFTATCIFVLTC